VGALLCGILAILVVVMRSRKRTVLPTEPRLAHAGAGSPVPTAQPVQSASSVTPPSPTASAAPPLNPTIEEITAIAERNGGQASMNLKLDGSDVVYRCLFTIGKTEKGKKQNDLVRFLDHGETARWTDRYTKLKRMNFIRINAA
jgi:hypothetical protein